MIRATGPEHIIDSPRTFPRFFSLIRYGAPGLFSGVPGPLSSQIMCVGNRPLLRVGPFILVRRYS
jgi:hypothetical protein